MDRIQYPILRPQFWPTQNPIQFTRVLMRCHLQTPEVVYTRRSGLLEVHPECTPIRSRAWIGSNSKKCPGLFERCKHVNCGLPLLTMLTYRENDSWSFCFLLFFNGCGCCSIIIALQDTDIVIWDVIAEAGMYRLRGHKGQVTQARFMQRCSVLISRWAEIATASVVQYTNRKPFAFI